MSEPLEDFLRQLMVGLGKIVEKVIGEAHKAKFSVGSRGGLQPVLSLEGQVAAAKIKEMISFAIEKIYLPSIPNLKGQTALEICDGQPSLTQRFLNQQARMATGVDISGSHLSTSGDISRGYVISGSPSNLPFEAQFFDYVFARLATNLQGDLLRCAREIARVLAPGGQGVFIDFHPFGLYAKKGSNRLHSAQSIIRGIEDYYKICRTAGLRIVDLRESFIDEEFRPMFDPDGIESYRNIKGTPLVVFVYFFKPRSKK